MDIIPLHAWIAGATIALFALGLVAWTLWEGGPPSDEEDEPCDH